MGGAPPQHPWNVHGSVRRAAAAIGKPEDREWCWCCLGLPCRSDRGNSHLLARRCGITAPIAKHRQRKRCCETETRGHGERTARNPHVAGEERRVGKECR